MLNNFDYEKYDREKFDRKTQKREKTHYVFKFDKWGLFHHLIKRGDWYYMITSNYDHMQMFGFGFTVYLTTKNHTFLIDYVKTNLPILKVKTRLEIYE